MALLKAWSDLDYNIRPDRTNSRRGDCFPECVNTERFLTVELTEPGGTRTYTERFHLIESGDFVTEAGFDRRLGEMFTEGFKARYLGSSAGQMFRFKDGEAYVAGLGYLGLTMPEAVFLEVEKNGDTIAIAAHNAANGESCSAVLERSESGFMLADVNDGAMSGFQGCSATNPRALTCFSEGKWRSGCEPGFRGV